MTACILLVIADPCATVVNISAIKQGWWLCLFAVNGRRRLKRDPVSFVLLPNERLTAGLPLGRARARTRVCRIHAAPPRGGRGDWEPPPPPLSLSLSGLLLPPAPAPIVDKRRSETKRTEPGARYRRPDLAGNLTRLSEQLEKSKIGTTGWRWEAEDSSAARKPWVTTGCFVSVADWAFSVVRLRGRPPPPRRPRVIRYHMMLISVYILGPIMTAFRLSLCLCVSPLRKVWPRWFGGRTAAGRRGADAPPLPSSSPHQDH